MVTGGWDKSSPGRFLKKVTRYSRTGEAETLPELNVGRSHHACGFYLTDQGDEVRFIIKYQLIMVYCLVGPPGDWRDQSRHAGLH